MKHSANEQESLVNILLRYWQEICAIEEECGLRVGKGDMRARIDYFHDAIRAFTAPGAENNPRLSVEQLAYDVRCLRYIASQPLASITHDAGNYSPSHSLVAAGAGLVPSQKKADRDTKNRLRELYEQYGVLFAALLKNTAENDYHERTDALNNDVEQINAIAQALAGKASAQEINNLVANLDDEKIKRDLLALLPQIKGKNAAGLVAKLKGEIQKKDKSLKAIDTAFHHYATSQLAIYESAKDMLKKMAGQGMNLVGQFVEASLRQSQQGRGR